MDYYENPKLSNSMIKLINKSYSHYLGAKFLKTTLAMDVGSAFHCYILENDKFHERYIVKPEGMSFTKKDGIAWRDTQLEKGLQIIKEEDFLWFDKALTNLKNHRLYPLMTGDTQVEQEIYFDYNGVECKGKMDLINHSNKIIFDLKSIQNCEKAEMKAKFDYSSQGYFYEVGAKKCFNADYIFVLVFCEKDFPNQVKFISLSAETREYGKRQIDNGIEKYKYLQENPDCFKGYNDDFIIV